MPITPEDWRFFRLLDPMGTNLKYVSRYVYVVNNLFPKPKKGAQGQLEIK